MKQKVKQSMKMVLSHVLYSAAVLSKRKPIQISQEEGREILMRHHPNPGTTPLTSNIVRAPVCDLTIILPVYNVEDYLDVCLRSILQQKTQYTYRIIAVDDGSTDSSGKILDSYADEQNLTIVHQQNGGLSCARNTGLREIVSRYIMFVDSDDILTDNAVETLMETACRLDADIVQGGYYHFDSDTRKSLHTHSCEENNAVPPNGVFYGMAWGKVYKAELFRNICFPVGYWYEDTIITSIVTHLAKRRATVSGVIYKYRWHKASITNIGVGNPKSIDTFWVMECVLKARNELGLETDLAFYEHILRQIILNYKRTVQEPENVKQSIFLLTKGLLMRLNQPTYFNVSRRYKHLNKAILDGHYRGYCACCRYGE